MSKKNLKIYNKLFFFAVSVVFIIVFVRQFGSISEAIETLSRGSWLFLAAIIVIQFVGIVNRGAFYHSLYEFFSVKDSLKKLTYLSVASNFLNLAAPAGGLSGMAVFVSEAQKQGMSKTRSIFVNLFAYFLIYLVFILVLLMGLFYLFFNEQLYTYQLVTAGILFGAIIILIIIALVALKGAARVKKLMTFAASALNYIARFLQSKKVLISDGQIHLISTEISECLKTIQTRFFQLRMPVLHVLLIETIDILTLFYIFLAFRFSINIGVLISVYAISVLFSLVSITPGGIGVVEATMIVVLTNLQVPVELATISVMAYRFFTFWTPFVLGYFAFRKLQRQKLIDLENATG